MTREEQIEEAGMNYAEEMVLQVDQNTDLPIFRRMTQQHFSGNDLEEAFDAGAQWADKTMIDKAVKWLKSYRRVTSDGMGYIAGVIDDTSIEDFRKAMEE